MIAIMRREIASYFNSATAWLMMAGYIFVLGFVFLMSLMRYSEQSISAASPYSRAKMNVVDWVMVPTFWWVGFLMMFVASLLTMRLIAEEARTGTLEMLFTYPLSEADIVLGKFFAAMTVVLSMLGLSGGLFLALSRLTAVEWKVVAAGYFGAVLIACAFISFGMFASSLTSHQVIAGGISLGGLLMAWLITLAGDSMESFKEVFGDLSIMSHLEQMSRGSISTHSIVYYLSFTVLFLFLTMRMLESRKLGG